MFLEGALKTNKNIVIKNAKFIDRKFLIYFIAELYKKEYIDKFYKILVLSNNSKMMKLYQKHINFLPYITKYSRRGYYDKILIVEDMYKPKEYYEKIISYYFAPIIPKFIFFVNREEDLYKLPIDINICDVFDYKTNIEG
jgi:hypothetical protein